MLFHEYNAKKDDAKHQFIHLQKANEEKLQKFIEFFEYGCYKLSWILNYGHNPVGGNNHTHGGVIDLLSRIRIPKDIYEKWTTEPEHGFLHGFCTLYMAYCLHPNPQWLWDNLHRYERHIDRNLPRVTFADNLIVSCLLHDILKCAGHTENHDQMLKNLTDELLPETYTHSNPPDQNNLLVMADRMELQRYQDSTSWIDLDRVNPQIEKYGGRELVNHFYKHIRPAIEKIFVGRKDIWFSHALEVRKHPIWDAVDEKDIPPNVEDNLGVSYYPKFHWVPQDEGYVSHMRPEYETYFSVHSDKLPLKNCIAHTKGYYRAQGIISMSTVKKYGCGVTCAPPSTGGRDHLFIIQNQKLPTNEWTFVYELGTNQMNQFDQIELNDLRTLTASLFNNIYRSTEIFLNAIECLCISQ